MSAFTKAVDHSEKTTYESRRTTAVREIRYMSHSRARKAGKWAIRKYSGVFKKLASA